MLATTALFSAAEQTHWALVVCDFEDSNLVFYAQSTSAVISGRYFDNIPRCV